MSLTGAALGPSLRSLVRNCARLVLFVIVFQLFAIDHWPQNLTEIEGIEGSHSHVLHCHGGSAGCADSTGVHGSLPDASLVPAPPVTLRGGPAETATYLPLAYIAVPDRPPSFIS